MKILHLLPSLQYNGAAKQALTADGSIALTAVGDVFEHQLKNSLSSLRKDESVGEKVKEWMETHRLEVNRVLEKVHEGLQALLAAVQDHDRRLQALEVTVAALALQVMSQHTQEHV